MTTSIKVENLGKKYIIGHEKQERYSTLRDSLAHSVRSFKQRLLHPLQPNREETELEEFWALKDIDFKIHSETPNRPGSENMSKQTNEVPRELGRT